MSDGSDFSEFRLMLADLAADTVALVPYLPGVTGTYELTVVGGEGQCVRSDAAADLELDVDALGAMVLGEPVVHGYAAAGRVRGEPAEVQRLARLFMTAQRPWCNQMF